MAQRVLLLVLAIVAASSCKMRTASVLQSADEKPFLYQEPLPLNRLPLNLLRDDEQRLAEHERWMVPPTILQTEQGYDDEAMGLRHFRTKEELQSYLHEGDIIVWYDPVRREKPDYISLVEHGMSHAAIIVSAERVRALPTPPKDLSEVTGKFCHIDSPSSMSGCDFSGPFHVFRVAADEATRAKAAQLAVDRFARLTARKVEGRDGSDYDERLNTDILNNRGFDLVRRQWSEKIFPMYCSELPLTVHSIAKDSLLIDRGQYPSDMIMELKALNERGRLELDLSDDGVRAHVNAFIGAGEALTPEQRRAKSTYFDQVLAFYLQEGAVGTASRSIANTMLFSPVVMPKAFMLEAKKTGDKKIFYIGTLLTSAEVEGGPPPALD